MVNPNITGTLVWYFFICRREVWLMAHQILPDESNEFLELGRFINENSYSREKKSVRVDNLEFDLIKKTNGRIVIGEVKKSSKYEKSACMQLAYYLLRLEQKGFIATGELLFPKEKLKIEVNLDFQTRSDLDHAVKEISNILNMEKAPLPYMIGFCKNCAYHEFCWV